MQKTDNPRGRTKYETLFDIDYAIELNARSRNFYTLLRMIFGFTFIASGSAALAAFQLSTGAQVVLSFIVTVLGILSVMLDPGAKAAQHEAFRQKWVALKKEAQHLQLLEIEDRLNDMYSTDLSTPRALHPISYNAVWLRLGHDDQETIQTTRFQRFMGWIT